MGLNCSARNNNSVKKTSITTVLFDLDETLSDHSYSLDRAFRGIQDEYPAMREQEMALLKDLYRESLDETFVGFINGEITHQEARRQRVARFFEKLGSPIQDADIDPFLSRYSEIYMSDRRATVGSINTLKILRERGYKIGIVSNGAEDVQTEKLPEIGVESFVDVLITSGAVGFAKPAPEIFEEALKRLGAKKEEMLMIGDNLENDIRGAVQYGMRAIYYAPQSVETEIMVDDIRVSVISHMEQVLGYLGLRQK